MLNTKGNKAPSPAAVHGDHGTHEHEDTELLQLVFARPPFPSLSDRMHVPVCLCVFTDICLERETRISATAHALYPGTD